MATASGTLKRLSLELGGKAPCLVLEDADIPAAVAGITAGATVKPKRPAGARAASAAWRESGFGRLHGVEGLNDFLQTKHIYHEDPPA